MHFTQSNMKTYCLLVYIITMCCNNFLILVVQGDPSSFDKLKFRIRHLLLQQEVELLPKLRVIDRVQRLGVAYHFDNEISAILNSVSMERRDIDRMDDVRLMTLSFRLLRQNNYPVSPGN